jgi:protein-disulfide isomerase
MAASVGIDTTAWQACYTQGVSVVEADVRAASDAGLRGTPSFIVDGKPLPGVPASEAAWDQVVEQAKNQ